MSAARKLWIIMAVGAVSACSGGQPRFESLSEQDLAEPPAPVADAEAPEGAGIFARLLGGLPAQDASLRTLAAAPEEVPETESDGEAAAAEAPEGVPTLHKSIFGIMAPKPEATSEVAPGTLLPYGQVARVCGLPKSALGKQIAQHPEKRPRHRIFDSDPGNTAPHSFFLTGFDDGCARQFTASLAMFGSVAMHEQLRYGLPSEVQPYSTTDKAYEKLKGRVCGVPRKKPCGPKVGRLDSDTVFVSIYERFGSNPSWTNLLLHDGDILAQDEKGS